MLYRVIWEIDIEARNPKQAANNARAIQLDPENQSNYFTVRWHNAERQVEADLNPRKESRS